MWIVYLKEIRELLRDRKTFIFTVLIPIVIMPVLIGGFAYLGQAMSNKAERAVMTYAIFGQQNAPAIGQRLADDKLFREYKLSGEDAIKDAIGDDRIKFALVIPAGFDATVNAHQQAKVTLHFNSTQDGDITRKRVMAIVDAHNKSLQESALPSLGLSASQLSFALKPVLLEESSTANQRERMGSIVGRMLPYILIMVCLMAAMYPAIDLGAGEKERGTLETLLLAPIPRHELVLAKFSVLFTFGMASALFLVLSIGLFLHFFGAQFGPVVAMIVSMIGVPALGMVALMLIPTVAIFASLLLAMSIYAKSYKEASGMMQPLMIMTMLPVMLAAMPSVKLTWLWAMVPLTNVSLAIMEIIKGTMDYRMFIVILVSTALLAGALLAWCCKFFNREEVLFRN
jgi:sodium transport system permease protein